MSKMQKLRGERVFTAPSLLHLRSLDHGSTPTLIALLSPCIRSYDKFLGIFKPAAN